MYLPAQADVYDRCLQYPVSGPRTAGLIFFSFLGGISPLIVDKIKQF